MKKQDNSLGFRGKYLFTGVVILYGVLFFINSDIALSALQKGSAILLKLLPIFVVVILLTALLNYFLRPKNIADHLGRESGVKAWLWTLAAGVLSHGPIYAWYPMLLELRRHGMRDGLIVAFFASRTIKVPLLPMMIDYFGWAFTLVLSFYVLIGALVQGLILELFEGKD